MITRKIKTLLGYNDMTVRVLADKINTSSPNLSQKMKRDNFSEHEMLEIADALNCDLEIIFRDRETGKEF